MQECWGALLGAKGCAALLLMLHLAEEKCDKQEYCKEWTLSDQRLGD